ncbi:isocitrate lyase/PEP mutase family protein [Rhodospirillaceae bacterium SYSU D60014]|uniref:isocitrate lyase/PEP mutase family protein n=1 Tax=Virgifigura deserti TaxID=2268457 RepID=UPI000E663FD8
MRRTTRFRLLVEAPEILLLPGAHDALSVRLAEQAGFAAVTCGGYSAAASLLGAPDVGQLGMSEMAEMYARLADCTDLPIFADGDTGHGNTTNVARTVRAFERAGVAGLFIEDQVAPKRCGHMAGKRVVPAAEMVAKLKAALDARIDADLVIMARTDARAVHGLDEAIERAQLYCEAGADLLFVEAPVSVEELRRVCSEIPGPCLANNIEGGRTPLLPAAALEEMGFAAVTFPVAATYAVAEALRGLYSALARDGTTAAVEDRLMTFDEFNVLIGLPAVREAETAYEEFARDLVDLPAFDEELEDEPD